MGWQDAPLVQDTPQQPAGASASGQPAWMSAPTVEQPKKSRVDDFEPLIVGAANKYGVDPRIVRAVVSAESSGDPTARSPKGAGGLMQLMPATAMELGVKNVDDPAQNIDGGVRYLKKMLDANDGDLRKALASYNWGLGNVQRNGLGKAPKETRDYMAKIMANMGDEDVPFLGGVVNNPETPVQQRAQGGETTIAQDVARGMMGFNKGLFEDVPDAVSQMTGLIIPDSVERFMDVDNKTLAERVADKETAYKQKRAELGGEGFDPGRLAGNIVNPASLATGAAGNMPKILASLSPAGQATLLAAMRGGVAGGLQPVDQTTGNSIAGGKAQQVGLGAVLGPVAEGVGRLATKGVGKLMGARSGQLTPEAQNALALAQSNGVKLSAGDIAPENKMLTGVEGALENTRIPGLSMSGFRKQQQLGAAEVAKKLRDQEYAALQKTSYMGEDRLRALASSNNMRSPEARKIVEMIDNAGTDERAIMQASGNLTWLRKKISADKLFNNVQEIAGTQPVPASATLKAIDDALKDAQNVVDLDPKSIADLNRWRSQLESGGVRMDDDAVEAAVRQFEGAPTSAHLMKLPSDLARAKPRYNSFGINFESDVDMAAYIATQANPSKRDKDYLNFAMRATGMTDSQVRRRGQEIKDALKAQAQRGTQSGGNLTVPAGQYTAPTAQPTVAAAAQGATQDAAEAVPNTYARMRGFRSDLRKRLDAATTNETTDSSMLFLKRIANAVEEDMDTFAQKTPGLSEANKAAQEFYKRHVVPYQKAKLAGALTSDDPDKIYGAFIRAQAEGRGDYAAKELFNALDEKGRQAVRYGIVRQALANSTDQGRFSPDRFKKALESTEYGQFFKGDKQRVDGVVNLMGMLRNASPEHLEKYAPMLGGTLGLGSIGLGAMAIGPGKMAAGLGTAAFMRWLMTSNAGKRALFSSNVLAKNGSKAQIGKYLDDLARQFNAAAGTAAGAEIGKPGTVVP